MASIDITKILKEAFNILKNNLEIVALYVIQLVIIGILGFALLGVNIFMPATRFLFGRGIIKMLGYFVVFIIISIIVQVTVTSATIIFVASVKKRRKISIGEALSLGVKKVPKLFVASIITGIIVGLGTLALIIPGIYLLIRLILYQQACVLEKRGLGIKKSWKITKGHGWEIFALLIVLAIISLVISVIPVIGPLITSLFVAPLAMTAWTLVYLKLARK